MGARENSGSRSARRLSPLVASLAVATICACAGFWYFSSLYKHNEARFSFYQKYFHAALNLYCVGDPDARFHNLQIPYNEERINLQSVSCDEIRSSEKHPLRYWNGWHDTHTIFSTLVAFCWNWLGLDWINLWPIAGLLGALTVLAFYAILRSFGLPWHAAALLLPACIPFNVIGIYFFFLRDFSKVPFILLAFGLLGPLFNPAQSRLKRLVVLSAATLVAVIGHGFRQDTLVVLPIILVAALLTTPGLSAAATRQSLGELSAIAITFLGVTLALSPLKTSETVQLQGYPHFLLQGFADQYWHFAWMKLSGLSFLSFYSDMLAWAFVDANSPANVGYFASFDPGYTISGMDLIARYAALAAPELIIRVFQAWSATSHGFWILKPIAVWLALFGGLIALGRWRLGVFLTFTCLSLAAAGTAQFDIRHILHFVMLDRVLLVIFAAASIEAAWNSIQTQRVLRLWLAAGFLALSMLTIYALLAVASVTQDAAITKLKQSYASLTWEPLANAPPPLPELMLRYTIAPEHCGTDEISAHIGAEGEKTSYVVPRLDGKPRPLYFTVFNAAAEKLNLKVTVDVTPSRCIQEKAWVSLANAPVSARSVLRSKRI